MKKIPLTNKYKEIIHYAFVDDEDYDYVMSDIFGKWYYAQGYCVCKVKGKTIGLHRAIYKFRDKKDIPKKYVIDHIDRNPLNNCFSNLRLATRRENNYNSGVGKDNKNTNLKRVKLDKRRNKFQSSIIFNGKHIQGGMFENEREAGICCDILAKKYHGYFAYINFPDATEEEVKNVLKIMENPKKKKGSSKYKGVIKENDTWATYEYENYCSIFRGRFENETDAAILSDFYAKNKNNCKLNFTNTTKQEYDRVYNLRFSKIQGKYSSKMKGVSRRKNKWEASISKKNFYEYLGLFDTEEEAALAYNKRAKELLGDKAILNKIII